MPIKRLNQKEILRKFEKMDGRGIKFDEFKNMLREAFFIKDCYDNCERQK